MRVFIINLLIYSSTLMFAASEPDVESVAIAKKPTVEEVVGSTHFDGWNWSLVKIMDSESGALFIVKSRNGREETVGGDSSPFPLSRYAIPPEVVKRLAEIYVENEIKNTPGEIGRAHV